jgi:hypothetical protein
MSIAEKFEVIADAVYDKGVSDGGQAEKKRFFDTLVDSKNGDFDYCFFKWHKDCYNPTKDIVGNKMTSMYSYSSIEDTGVTITYTGTALGGAFYRATNLKRIKEFVLVNDTTVASSAFSYCSSLEEITISGNGKILTSFTLQDSKYLNKASIKSIVDALSPNVTGQTVTFSKAALKSAFGIEITSDANIPTDNEFYNLRWSKPNWTFGYSN